MATLKCPFCW